MTHETEDEISERIANELCDSIALHELRSALPPELASAGENGELVRVVIERLARSPYRSSDGHVYRAYADLGLPWRNARVLIERVRDFVPAGDYVFGVEAAECVVSKNSGNDQIKLTLRILKADGTQVQSKVFDYLQFDEKNVWKLDTFLKCIQRQPPKGAEVEIDNDWLQANVIGGVGRACFGLNEYNCNFLQLFK